MSNGETIKAIASGYHMDPPDACPDDIGRLMTACWNIKPERRPTFKESFDVIEQAWTKFRHATSPVVRTSAQYDNKPTSDCDIELDVGYIAPRNRSIGDGYSVPKERSTESTPLLRAQHQQ